MILTTLWRFKGPLLIAALLLSNAAAGRWALAERDGRIRAQTAWADERAVRDAELVRHNDRVALLIAQNDTLRAETSRLRMTLPSVITNTRTLYATDTLRMPPVVDTLIRECESCARKLGEQERQIAELTRLLREKPLTVTKVETRSCAVPLSIGLVLGAGGGFIAGFNERGRH